MKTRLLILFLALLAVVSSAGCINARVWGDNFLRGWFHGNSLKNKVTDNSVHNTNLTGISGTEIPAIVGASSTPFIFLVIFLLIRQKKQARFTLGILVGLIEHFESAGEIKKISAILSRCDRNYRKLVNRELKKLKS